MTPTFNSCDESVCAPISSFPLCSDFVTGYILFHVKTHRLMDVKQGQNKEGKTVLYLVFEYMDTDLKKYIRLFRSTGDHIPSETVKV